jgi:hypothetical protein
VSDLAAGLLIVLALSLTVWSLVYVVRDKPLDDSVFWAVAVLELGAVVALVGGAIALAATERDVESATFVGYLLTMALVLPVAVVWAISEKSRWGMAVVAVGCLTVAALALRADQVWSA